MKNMQTKILEAFERIAANAGLEAVQKGDSANTGHVYIQDGFDTLLDIRYSFQSGYCTLALRGPAVTALGLADSPPAYRVGPAGTVTYHALKYADSERVKAMLALVGDIAASRAGAA
jgi:hypothetical protein